VHSPDAELASEIQPEKMYSDLQPAAAPAMARPALIVVDMQNDFVRAGAPMEVPAARGAIAPGLGLLSAFRAAGLPVAFTRYVACPDYRHLADRLGWVRLLEPPVNACVPGHLRTYADRPAPLDCAEVIDELAPLPGETVIDKTFFSAFHGTDLDARLRAAGADGVIVAGTLTEMCVEDTARHAVHLGYPTVLVRDAVASNDPVAHAATLRAFAINYGWTMNAREAAALLARAAR
jgi:ureidoacrylate peracid hydrolase